MKLNPSLSRPDRQHRSLRPVLAAATASVVLGATFAACADTSPAEAATAEAATAKTTPAAFSPGAGSWPAGPGWAGSAMGQWGPSRPAGTEYFHVASTSPAGPGTIIITGPVNAGGTERPGRGIDAAAFAGGGFRIDHSYGQPTARFNAETCVGTIDQTGRFSVIDGTGRFSGFAGSGAYVFHALYTTGRNAKGCSKVMTGYIESIDGSVTLSPSVIRSLTEEGAAG